MIFTQGRHPRGASAHRQHALTKRCWIALALCILVAMMMSTLAPDSHAFAHGAGAHTPPSGTAQEQLRQALKRKIHVTHHAAPKTTSPALKAASSLLPAYNNVGTSNDNNPTSGSFDGNTSYSAQAMQSAGLIPGQNFTFNNVTFVWPNAPAGKPNNYLVKGQVIPVTPSIPNAAKLGFLGASTFGNASGTATITFTDATTQTATLNMNDWVSSLTASGDVIAAQMSYHNVRTTQLTENNYIFYTDVTIPAGKTVQSVTLPTSSSPGQMHIFTVGISGPAYNNTGTSDDSAPTSANLDGGGYSLSAQALQSAGIQPNHGVIADGISYTWPGSASGAPNNYQANGQVLPVVPVTNATTLGVLGISTGSSTSGTATITYTDASTQTFTLGLTNWWNATPAYSNIFVATYASINQPTGKRAGTYYLYATEVNLQAGKTIQSLTLPPAPSSGQLHIFAVATRTAYNNIGTSDDGNPTAAQFDSSSGKGYSYSAQALQAAHITGGHNIVVNGIAFTWPAGIGTGNNYQAAGQTIPVTPVPNATTLGFLGADTNGSATGTATITYTDATTQTFTLGMTDWWTGTPAYSTNTLAVTLPYINSPTGTHTGSYYIYEMETSLQLGKTIQSVTLPATVTAGQMHIFAIGTHAGYNNIGISDDANPTSASFDNSGNSYSSQDFTDPNTGMGWNPGDTLTYNGMNFIWPNVPAGQADNYAVQGQTIPVTPVANADTIGFVGASSNGDGAGNIIINYTDATTQTYNVGMGDWTLGSGAPKPSYNNFLFALLDHRNTTTGQQNLPTYLFYEERTLQAGKVVQSITLPSSSSPGKMHIFTIGTRAGNTYMNNVGTSDDTSTAFANYDHQGHSYSLQALQAAAHITEGNDVFFNGVDFIWPAGYSVLANNYQAAGQTIAVTPAANATTLAFLGSSTNGNASGTATITYTDNSTQTFTLGFTDWTISTIAYGNRLVTSMPYLNTSTGSQNTATYLYEAETALQAGKTIQSVTLPTISGQLHVFAVGTRAGPYNSAGVSDDTAPYTANFDGTGHSYSLQGLQSNGLVAGQPSTINGVTFTWPNVGAGLFNNYQAAGQTIAVAPVANATTLAFLGSATNGNTSGTATITYTDNSTQTFTLGFADWCTTSISSLPYGNSVAATMPYRNGTGGTGLTPTNYVFYTSTTLQAGKTIQSVTLPTTSSGAIHVFAISTQ